ncbi:MAG: FG-GAP-like repeat-containing protein [Bryobacteraceae bacterium]
MKGSAWRLTLGDLDGDGSRELIYGSYDNAVRAVDPSSGRLLWETPLDGFPFSVTSADAGNDRRVEVFAATAGGSLYAISSEGRVLWRVQPDRYGRAQYNVTAGRDPSGRLFIASGGVDRTVSVFSADGKRLAAYPVQQLVHRLLAADFDGDGASELAVIDRRTDLELLEFDGKTLTSAARRTLQAPPEFRNWENPRGLFYAFSLESADVNGDGLPELLMGDTYFNKQAVMACSARGEPLWVSPPLPSNMNEWRQEYSPDKWYEFYSTAFVRPAEVFPASPGPEVIAVSGGNLRIFSSQGRLLSTAESSIGFTDVVIDGPVMYLGSSPNGDETIYRLPVGPDMAAAFRNLERHGLPKRIEESIDILRRQVSRYKPGGAQDDQKYLVFLFHSGATAEALKRTQEEIAWFRNTYPYANLKPAVSIKVIEPEPPLDPEGKPWNPARWATDSINGTMSVEQILATARLIEQMRVPTMFNVGHSCMPFVTLDTARRMLEAAPEYLLGFESAEDENPQEFPRFAEHFLGPLADLSLLRGQKRAITRNKGLWWMSVPAIPKVFQTLFAGPRRNGLVGSTEDSNSRTPEINLFARMGLRQAGLVRSLHASVIGDLFSFCRFFQWEYPKHGHPYLRLLVAHTLMGAESVGYRMGLMRDRTGYRFTRMGEESIELFLHMLGKGIVFCPRPDQMVGISRVGIAVHQPPEKWYTDAHNGHRPEIWQFDEELEQGVLPRNGSLWGMTPTPEHALTRVLFHKQRQFGYHVPPTPYGPVAIVPALADLKSLPYVEQWWHTDGIYLWREGGPKLAGKAAADALRQSLEQAAAKLPFRSFGDDVFLHTVKMDGGGYRLYLIDPGWLDPRNRQVEIRIQLASAVQVRDLLSGEVFNSSQGRFRITIPAGSLRILDAR